MLNSITIHQRLLFFANHTKARSHLLDHTEDKSIVIIANLQQKLTALEMRVIDLKMHKAQILLQTSMSNLNTSMGAFERMEKK